MSSVSTIPDFVLPYIVGRAGDVKKGLYLWRFGVLMRLHLRLGETQATGIDSIN